MASMWANRRLADSLFALLAFFAGWAFLLLKLRFFDSFVWLLLGVRFGLLLGFVVVAAVVFGFVSPACDHGSALFTRHADHTLAEVSTAVFGAGLSRGVPVARVAARRAATVASGRSITAMLPTVSVAFAVTSVPVTTVAFTTTTILTAIASIPVAMVVALTFSVPIPIAMPVIVIVPTTMFSISVPMAVTLTVAIVRSRAAPPSIPISRFVAGRRVPQITVGSFLFTPPSTVFFVLGVLVIHPLEQLLLELSVHRLRVHEVAEATSLTGAFLVLSALGLAEVRHWRVLGNNHASAVVASVHDFHSGGGLLFICKLDVNVADHVVPDVVRDDHLLHLAELRHLHEHFLVEGLEVLDRLHQVLLRHVPPVGESDGRVRVLVHVLEAHGLAQWRLVVDASASIAVPTRSNFEVERAVDPKIK